MFVFLLEATVGGLAYIYENQITDELQESLNTTFLEYYGVDEEKTAAIDRMQQDVIWKFCADFTIKPTYHFSILVVERSDLKIGSTVIGLNPMEQISCD